MRLRVGDYVFTKCELWGDREGIIHKINLNDFNYGGEGEAAATDTTPFIPAWSYVGLREEVFKVYTKEEQPEFFL